MSAIIWTPMAGMVHTLLPPKVHNEPLDDSDADWVCEKCFDGEREAAVYGCSWHDKEEVFPCAKCGGPTCYSDLHAMKPKYPICPSDFFHLPLRKTESDYGGWFDVHDAKDNQLLEAEDEPTCDAWLRMVNSYASLFEATRAALMHVELIPEEERTPAKRRLLEQCRMALKEAEVKDADR